MSESSNLHAVPEPTDPFDADALRATPLEAIAVEKVMLSVAVRRPGRAEFFRVHSEPDFSVDWFVLEHDGDGARETYWVTVEYRAALLDELRPVRVFTCINKRGTVFLWPAKLPTPDNTLGRRWHESALAIADAAKTSWVKMVGNRDAGVYDMFRAKGDLGEPEWPDKSLSDLLRLGFAGERLIDRLDHPVLKELAGEL
jgi:hypothetical protein